MSNLVRPVELEFYLDDFRSLRFPPGSEECAYDFLTRKVGREPRNLLFHVCRIKAATHHREETVFGALFDLMWVLQDKGRSLQRRMLQAARRFLSAERYALLQRSVENDLPLASIPYSPCALFHEGAWGSVFAAETVERAAPVYDPLTVAKGCLEAGQIDQAREILQAALESAPHDPELRQYLLEIYQATGDVSRFLQSFRLLEAKGIDDPAWRETYGRFAAQIEAHNA